MNHLFTYVSALSEAADGLSIVNTVLTESSSEEHGAFVERSELIVYFDNGVQLKKETERDHADTLSDDVCNECWISYNIICQPESLNVTPVSKVFSSPCQESFWLKINKIQTV